MYVANYNDKTFEQEIKITDIMKGIILASMVKSCSNLYSIYDLLDR